MMNDKDKNYCSCKICFEKFTSLKFLGCGNDHAMCLKCIKKLPSTAVANNNPKKGTITCPFDRKSTILPEGKAEKLKTKLFINLACENCLEKKSFNECWWCETCMATVCGSCAFRKHRQHTCNEWNDFHVPKELYDLYKSKISLGDPENCDKWRTTVHELCVGLEESLMNFVREEECLKNAMVRMEKTFGPLESTALPEGCVVEKLEKKMSILSKVMQMECGRPSFILPRVSNVIKRKECCLPSVEEVFDFCCNSKEYRHLPGLPYFSTNFLRFKYLFKTGSGPNV